VNHNGGMSARWVTFLLWAVVAASAVAWGLKLFVTPPPPPRDVRVADASLAVRGDPSRVLGVDAAPPADGEAEADAPRGDARFQLLGVVAPRAPQAAREGVALIAVDGNAPKAYRVGAKVADDTVLKAVRARGADLGPRDGDATIALEIAPPPPAATGVLPPAGAGPAPAAALARPPIRPGAVPQYVPPPGARLPQPGPMPNPQPQPQPQPGAPDLQGAPQGVTPQDGLPRS
jgi:general secretion pathway protein C